MAREKGCINGYHNLVHIHPQGLAQELSHKTFWELQSSKKPFGGPRSIRNPRAHSGKHNPSVQRAIPFYQLTTATWLKSLGWLAWMAEGVSTPKICQKHNDFCTAANSAGSLLKGGLTGSTRTVGARSTSLSRMWRRSDLGSTSGTACLNLQHSRPDIDGCIEDYLKGAAITSLTQRRHRMSNGL